LGRGIEHRERPFNKIPLKRLADNRPRRLVVILSGAKNLINLNTYAFKILRLTPQNDIFGQLLNPPLEKGDFYDQVPGRPPHNRKQIHFSQVKWFPTMRNVLTSCRRLLPISSGLQLERQCLTSGKYKARF
jgi:hypothetical protein